MAIETRRVSRTLVIRANHRLDSAAFLDQLDAAIASTYVETIRRHCLLSSISRDFGDFLSGPGCENPG